MLFKKSKYRPFIIASIVVFVLWVANWSLLLLGREERGVFGDMFGTVNSLFTGLSFAGIIYAMYLQNKELSLQRRELRDTRTVMKEQSETLKLQTAETTFFRLLENHRSLVSSLSFTSNKNGYEGLNSFYTILKKETIDYYQAAMLGKVMRIEVCSYYPIRKLKHQIENIEQIYSNVLHLIDFIKVKLNDEVFYHQTFYNSLSKAEKYILGLYVVNEQSRMKNSFQSKKFNYIEYFEGSGNAYFDKNKVPFLPEVNFQFSDPNCKLNLVKEYFDRNIGNIEIEIINNEANVNVKLIQTSLKHDWKSNSSNNTEEWELDIIEKRTISLGHTIGLTVFKHFRQEVESLLKAHYNSYDIYFDIEFIFDINGKINIYRKKFRANFSNISYDSGSSVSVHIESR